MLVGRRAWILALAAACASSAPDAEVLDEAPDDPPPARPVTAPVEPAPASAAAMCDSLDERIRVRIEDALRKCERGPITGCTSDMTFHVANCSDEPVLLRGVGLLDAHGGTVYGLGRGRGGTMVGEEVVQIAPDTVWSLTVGYYNRPDWRLHIDVVDTHGAAIPVTTAPVRVSNPARLTALAACTACDGTWDHEQDRGCNCKTRDFGQACDDAAACEGACLFDHWQISTPTPRPRCTGKRCTDVPSGIGRPIGRCAEYMETDGGDFLESGLAALPDQPVPWGVQTKSGCLIYPFLGHPSKPRR